MNLLIFDFDGVIVDSIDDLTDACNQALEASRHDRRVTRDDLRVMRRVTVPGVAELAGFPHDRMDELREQFIDVLDRERAMPLIWPGMAGVLRALAQEHPICVVTSNTRQTVERVLGGAGVLPSVRLILDVSDRREKDAKIRQCVEQVGAGCRRALMIGDAMSDLEDAARAGVEGIGVAWGYQPRELLEGQPHAFIAENPEGLLRWLRAEGA